MFYIIYVCVVLTFVIISYVKSKKINHRSLPKMVGRFASVF